jgi:hypothetical protein
MKHIDKFEAGSLTPGDRFYQKFDHLIGQKFAKSNLESMIEFIDKLIKSEKKK